MLRTGDVVRVVLVLLALASAASRGSAYTVATFDPLAPRIHVSANGRYAVAIVPKAPAEGLALRERGGAHFYAVDPDGEHRFVGWFDLVNEVAPTDALVSDDGRFLVTFGDRRHGDDGAHAVVLYRTDGSLVRSLAPADILTPTDLAGVAGRWHGSWREGQLIDESGTVLVLRIHRCGAHDACLEESPQVAFRLDDGTPLRPARDLLPHKVPGSRLVPGEAPEGERPFHPDDPAARTRRRSRAPRWCRSSGWGRPPRTSRLRRTTSSRSRRGSRGAWSSSCWSRTAPWPACGPSRTCPSAWGRGRGRRP